jgi:hypothetical protein
VSIANTLRRDAVLRFADRRLAEARRWADFADDAGQLTAQVVTRSGKLVSDDGFWWDYWQALDDASFAYKSAGLGLLAGRVAFMARRVAELGERENVRDAWQKFDRLNAGGCGVA